jgi:hypothetical protein
VTDPETLPEDVAALRALVLTAWAERDAERAEKARLADQSDRLRRPDANGEVQMGGPHEDKSTEAGHRDGGTE